VLLKVCFGCPLHYSFLLFPDRPKHAIPVSNDEGSPRQTYFKHEPSFVDQVRGVAVLKPLQPTNPTAGVPIAIVLDCSQAILGNRYDR
jgi:hypothetical protein